MIHAKVLDLVQMLSKIITTCRNSKKVSPVKLLIKQIYQKKQIMLSRCRTKPKFIKNLDSTYLYSRSRKAINRTHLKMQIISKLFLDTIKIQIYSQDKIIIHYRVECNQTRTYYHLNKERKQREIGE